MTPQEIFNTSRDHVLAQGKPAISITGSCLYTTTVDSETLHCGAYPFMNEIGKARCVEGNWDTLGDEYKIPGTLEHNGLIIDLQKAHDFAASETESIPEMFLITYKTKLIALAMKHSLIAGV